MSARTSSLASYTVNAGAVVVLLAGLLGGAACKDGGEDSAPPPVSTPQPGVAASQALLDAKAAGAPGAEATAATAAAAGAASAPGQPPTTTAGAAKAPPSTPPGRRPPAARRGGGDVPEYYEERGTATASAPRRTPWIQLPGDARLGEETIPGGRYEVKVESAADGPRIVLYQDGEAVASELAVRPTAQPGNAATGSWLWRDERDEKLYRLFSQQGRDLFFVVLEQS